MTQSFTLSIETELVDPCLDEAWRMYENTMSPMADLAVARHLLTRDEFVATAQDKRVSKFIATDDQGHVCAVATYTNDLDTMSLISPPYFARRWPEEYAEQRIWYCGFIVVRDGARGVFTAIIEAMYEVVTKGGGGVSMFDVCTHNATKRRIPDAISALLRHMSAGVTTLSLEDTQGFYVYEDNGGV